MPVILPEVGSGLTTALNFLWTMAIYGDVLFTTIETTVTIIIIIIIY